MHQAQDFLACGEQVQIQVQLKGRQKSRPESAVNLIENVVDEYLADHGKQVAFPKVGRPFATFNPKKK